MKNLREDLELFNDLVDFLLEEEAQNPVAKRIDADELYTSLDLRLGEKPMSDSAYKAILKDVISSTPKTATPLFFNQLFGGRQGKAILGDLLAVMLNNSMYTYKVAGPQVGIEQELIRMSCAMIGYGPNSNGTFPTGGSMSNYMALIMARDVKDPEFRLNGASKRLVVYTSKESHYSNAKNASFAGIGRNNVRYIPVDQFGRMIPEALKEQIELDLRMGCTPTYVNATAGTTVLGAFDPFERIADICDEFDIWMHIDGAYSGAVFFSETHKHLLKGVERSKSFSFNAHKMLMTPLTCSIILVNDKAKLHQSFSNDANYLYQTDGDDFNLGKTSFQCGRRNDALKFWTLWKALGTEGLEEIIDQQFKLAQYAREYVLANSDYSLYSFENSISVCFNYRGIDPEKLCTALYENQISVVGFGSFNNDTFIRLVTVNAMNTEDEILHFFQVLETFVAENEESFDVQPRRMSESKSVF